jgi:hypothetical protein
MTTWDLVLCGGGLVLAVALAYAATTRLSGVVLPETTSPRHTRDLFGRPGATTTAGAFTGAIITCLDSDWPTPAEIEDAWWDWKWHALDKQLAGIAHDGNLRLAAAGIPLHVIAEHSVAEVQRHERALAAAESVTAEWPALVGAA